MTGRITMLGLSRWTGPGGSYRTVQRFFSTVIPWAMLFWVFFRQHVYCPQDVSHSIPSQTASKFPLRNWGDKSTGWHRRKPL